MTTKLPLGEHTPATRKPVMRPMIGPGGKQVLVPITPPPLPRTKGFVTQDGNTIYPGH